MAEVKAARLMLQLPTANRVESFRKVWGLFLLLFFWVFLNLYTTYVLCPTETMQKWRCEILWSALCKRSDEITAQPFSSCLPFSQKMPIWRKVQILEENISKIIYCKKLFRFSMEMYVSQNSHSLNHKNLSSSLVINQWKQDFHIFSQIEHIHTYTSTALHSLWFEEYWLYNNKVLQETILRESHLKLGSVVRTTFPLAPVISLPQNRLVPFCLFSLQKHRSTLKYNGKTTNLFMIGESEWLLLPFKSSKDVCCF